MSLKEIVTLQQECEYTVYSAERDCPECAYTEAVSSMLALDGLQSAPSWMFGAHRDLKRSMSFSHILTSSRRSC
jgi:hypothetical protein